MPINIEKVIHMRRKPIDIIFSGKDFTNIQDTLVVFKSEISPELKDYIENHKTKILVLFLDQIDLSTLNLNRSKYVRTRNDTEYFLYKKRDNELFYDGLAGIIARKNFKIEKREIDPSNDSNEIMIFNIKLLITSRFDMGKPFFLATMLLRDGIKFTDDTIPSSLEEIYDYLLMFIYKKHLEQALIKGFYKNYKESQKNDERVKGTIDISEYIRKNVGCETCRIPYRYKENTYSNNINQLIVAAYQHLKNKYPGIITLNFDNNVSIRKSIEMLKYLNPKTNLNILIKNSKPITHPYYIEYEDLRKTCIQILKNKSISFSLWEDMDNDLVNGFVFYLPDLWELFLEDIIKRRIIGTSITISVQGGENGINVLGKNRLFILSTYPDFVFKIAGKPVMILDAKFRPAWDNLLIEFKGWHQGNLLDDYTKCIRDMNTINGKATGVIYPTNIVPDGNYYQDDSIEHSISSFNKRDVFYVFPVTIPASENYDSFGQWKVDFEQYLTTAINKIINAIKKHKK